MTAKPDLAQDAP